MDVQQPLKIEKRASCGKVSAGLIAVSIACVPLLCSAASGGLQPGNDGARIAAMGYAATALAGDPWSMSRNPAAAGRVFVLSVYASPRPFDLPSLAHFGAAATVPLGSGSAGVALTRFGVDLYRETCVAVSWSQDVAEGVRLGTAVRGVHVGIERYGEAFAATVDAGVLVRPAAGVSLGASAANVTLSRIGDGEGERLPVLLSVGASWLPDSNILLCLDAVQDPRYPLALHAGLEYRLHDVVALRAGTSTWPNLFTAGIALHYGGIRMDYAYLVHPDLGGTHVAGIEFQPQGGLF